MIRAKVIEAFPGVPDGQTRPKKFREYDEVTGDLAEVAVREGWAELINGEAELDDEARSTAVVDIPADWRDLHWMKLKSIAAEFAVDVANKDEAVRAIEEYLAASDDGASGEGD